MNKKKYIYFNLFIFSQNNANAINDPERDLEVDLGRLYPLKKFFHIEIFEVQICKICKKIYI